MRKKRQLVWVEFIDHSTAAGWKSAADTDLERSNNTVNVVGWVIGENKEILQLSSWHIPNRSGDTTDSNLRSYIVKGAITKRKCIKL